MESNARVQPDGVGIRAWISTSFWLMALVCLLALPAMARDASTGDAVGEGQESPKPAWQVLEERPGAGEQCLVCKQAVVGAEIVEVRYQGRTFYIKKAMLPEFESDPERYFRDLQARSALFDEPAISLQSIASGWLIFGLYVLVGLIFGAICGYVAVGKALAPVPWFFAGLAGNVAAFFVLWVTPAGDASSLPGGIPSGLTKVPTTRAPVRCEACGSSNHPAAKVCSSCGAPLEPTAIAEVQAV